METQMSLNFITSEVNRVKTGGVLVPPGLVVGGNEIVLMAGPCSIENYDQVRTVGEALSDMGVSVMRGGAFKPRTSPHSFQGLGLEGLKMMRDVADEFGLMIITEALGVEHVSLVAEYADIIQIGSRNMQHFPLLWAVGETEKPVLLKRGFMSTIAEWMHAAEHVATRGNENIILCERGIRTFEPATRNTLDVNAISLVKQISPYPIIGDPSHGTGRADLVIPAARAAIAAGADGLIVEFHPDPANALSDGDQSLPLSSLEQFIDEVSRVAEAVGRNI